jgi:sugar-specific transcriptional regulator TrmB
MRLTKKSPLSKQSTQVYNLLLQYSALSAQEIAEELGIFPHAVYRTAHTLATLGLIEKTSSYPAKFQVKPMDEALDNYVTLSKNLFVENFAHGTRKKTSRMAKSEKLSISFIKTRNELLEMTNADIKAARGSIEHIVSGIELPAETMLAYKKAVDRGVTLKFLVQNRNELNHDMLANWRKAGLEVRYFPLLEARIIIFDADIVYLTSYNPHDKDEATGIRFAYPPIARQMKELFESKWKVAKPLAQR